MASSSSAFLSCLRPSNNSPGKRSTCLCPSSVSPPPAALPSADKVELFSNGCGSLPNADISNGCGSGLVKSSTSGFCPCGLEGGDILQRVSEKVEFEEEEKLGAALKDGRSNEIDDMQGFSSRCYCRERESKSSKHEEKQVQLLPGTMPWEFDLIESESTIPPWELDILLLDITKGILESSVSKILERPYLKPWVGPSTLWPVRGKLFGVNSRLMVSMSTSLSAKKAEEIEVVPMKIAVHYLVDTGSPTTFLCEDAVQALAPAKKFYYDEYSCIPVLIHGCKCQVHVSPARSHFKDVSVIGSDLLSLVQATLIVDYGDSKEFTLVKGPNIFEPADD